MSGVAHQTGRKQHDEEAALFEKDLTPPAVEAQQEGSEGDDSNESRTKSPSGRMTPVDVSFKIKAEEKDIGKPGPETASEVQDWSGPDDADNPQNWSMSSRIYHTSATAVIAFAATFGSAVYTPGYPDVATEFGISSTASLLGLSLYVLGLGAGPVMAAPLSETYGRNIVYRVTIPICMLFTLGAGFSQSLTQLLVCRFFAGFSGGPVLAVGSGSNADLWSTNDRAVSVAFFLVAPFLGPALGPIVGGYSVMAKGWRWTQWDTLFILLAGYILSLGMSETYKKIILERRAKKAGLKRLVQGPPLSQVVMTLLKVTLTNPIRMLLTEPIVAWLSLYVAFVFAVFFAFFAAFPIVFEGVYGFNRGQSGLAFLAIVVGVSLSVVTVIIIDKTIYKKHVRAAEEAGHNVAPEHRLYPAMMGGFGITASLFWFAWTSRKDIHWIVPVLAGIPFAWGNLCIFVSLEISI